MNWNNARLSTPDSDRCVLVCVRGSEEVATACYDTKYKAWHPLLDVTLWAELPPLPIEHAMDLQTERGSEDSTVLRDAVMALPVYSIRKFSKTCQMCGHPNMIPVHETLLPVWMEDGMPIDGPAIRDAEGTRWRVVRTPNGLRRRVEL